MGQTRYRSVTATAGQDLTNYQYHVGVKAADGHIDPVASAGAKGDGVILTNPSAVGAALEFAVDGLVKVKAGAAFTAGDDLTPDASGKLITATSGDVVFARAWEDAAGDGSIVEALLRPQLEPLS